MTGQLVTSNPRLRGSIALNLPTPISARNEMALADLRTASTDTAPKKELFTAKPRGYALSYYTELVTHPLTQLTVLLAYVFASWSLTANLGLTKAFPWSAGPLSNWLMWLASAVLLNLLASKFQRTEHSSITHWAPIVNLTGVTGRDQAIGYPGGPNRGPRPFRLYSRASFLAVVTLLAVPISVNARGSDSAEPLSVAPPALAFARYIALLKQRSPFTESGAVAVDIEASLPRLGKQAYLSAIRQTGASERSEYQVLHTEGDSTVKIEVIARYLSAQAEAEAVPLSSALVTPVNYKFHYVGSGRRMGALLYVFQIGPRKKRVGLFQGLLWIDPVTGVAVHRTGRFAKTPSVLVRRIDFTRDTSLRDGLPYVRITRAIVYTRLPVGHAELTITEQPLILHSGEAISQSTGEGAKP